MSKLFPGVVSEYKEHYKPDALVFNNHGEVQVPATPVLKQASRPVEKTAQNVEKFSSSLNKKGHVKEDIRELFIPDLHAFKDEKSDFKINYSVPEKSAYRVKRNAVFMPKHSEPSIAREADTEYKKNYFNKSNQS